MRIGVSAGAPTVDRIVEQAVQAEEDGFTTLWFAGAVAGDPLVAMALAGRATTDLELGTAVVQTYPCHPILMANRIASVVNAVGRPATFGIGPSHDRSIEGTYGLSYDHAGRHTEEYVSILAPLLRGERVDFEGADLAARAQGPAMSAAPSLLLAALAPRMLRVAGEQADGTVLWLATPQAIAEHVAPRIRAAADAAGRPAPRIVAGMPVAVHDDLDEARQSITAQFGFYDDLPNYRRLMDHGGAPSVADASLFGDEDAVTAQVEALFEAGATDVWAAQCPVGDDRAASRARTRALLVELAAR
jgi:F420-dependent oxidoreductase-like protein